MISHSPTDRPRSRRIFAALLSFVLCALAVSGAWHSAGAQVLCDSCVAPVIVFSPVSGTTDTLVSHVQKIDVCTKTSLESKDTVFLNGGVVSTSSFTSWIPAGCSATVQTGYQNGVSGSTYTLVVGTNTIKVDACISNFPVQCSTASATINHPALGVAPKGKTIPVTDSVPATQAFTVSNYTAASQTYTLAVTCTGSAIGCSTPSSVIVSAGTHDTVLVTYRSGYVGQAGTIQLKATQGTNADSAKVTLNVINNMQVNSGYTNQDDRDMTRCAQQCFAATASIAMVPYITRGVSRSVALFYDGDALALRPVIYADVSVLNGPPVKYELQAKVNGTFAKFTNGETALYFAGRAGTDSIGPFRLAGAIVVDSTLPTGAYGLQIVVMAQYSDHTEQITDSSHVLAVINTRQSRVARGWTIVHVPFLYNYHYPDGHTDQSRLLVPTGDGSFITYTSAGCGTVCTWTPPGGVFSTIKSTTGGFERDFPDSSKELYNSSGQITASISSTLADTVTYGYDGTGATGRLTSVSDPQRMNGSSHTYIQLNYGTYGLQSIVEPDVNGVPNQGRKTTVTVGSSDSLLHVWKDPDGDSSRFGYDSQKRLDSLVDRNKRVSTLSYEPVASKLASSTTPQVAIDANSTGSTTNGTLTTTYHAWQVVNVPTSPTSGTPWPVVRADSVWAKMTTPAGYTDSLRADRWGQPLAMTDHLGRMTTYSRDVNGYVNTVRHSTGQQDLYTYTAGLMTSYTPGYAHLSPVSYQYGAYGQLTKISGTNQATQTFYTSTRGHLDSVAIGSAIAAKYYPFAGNRSRDSAVVDAMGNTTLYQYDQATGNLSQTTAQASGRYTATTYDGHGRPAVVKISGPGGPITVTTTQYDSVNRVVMVYDGVHAVPTKHVWDGMNDTSITDPRGQTYRTTYNALGWPISQTDPLGRTVTTTYTSQGLTATVTNHRGQKLQYYYDADGREVGANQPQVLTGQLDNADTTIYSADGSKVTTSNGYSTEVKYYSLLTGLVDSTTTQLDGSRYFKQAYNYSAGGEVDSVVVSTTGVTQADLYRRVYRWNASTGLLDSLRIARPSDVADATVAFRYNANHLVDSTIYPSGVVRTDTYTDQNKPLGTVWKNLDHTVTRGYGYDQTGRMTEIDFSNLIDEPLELYSYDPLGELTQNQRGMWTGTTVCSLGQGTGFNCSQSRTYTVQKTSQFSFDSAGSLDTLKIVGGPDTVGTTSAGNALTAWGSGTFGADLDGNRSSASTSGATYTWGAAGQLLQVQVGTSTRRYDYDARGRLTRRSTNGIVDRYYLWDEDQLLAILDSAANKRIAEFVYQGTDQPLAKITGTPSTGDTVHFYAQDARGNIYAQFRGTTVEQTMDYEPWGTSTLTKLSGDTAQQLRWKGLLWEDGITSLQYVRARWYDPTTRRFVSPDPKGLAAGVNQYAFAGGDPINGLDPTGLDYYEEHCTESAMVDIEFDIGDAPFTFSDVPVMTCDFSKINPDMLPVGVYFGCRPIAHTVIFGHCAIQTVENIDILDPLNTIGTPFATYQLIPSNFFAFGTNKFPPGTSSDDQINWLLIPGTGEQSAEAVDDAAEATEDYYKQRHYPIFGVLGWHSENSNSFACRLLVNAGLQIPQSFLASPSPLGDRSYPLLGKGGDCVRDDLIHLLNL